MSGWSYLLRGPYRVQPTQQPTALLLFKSLFCFLTCAYLSLILSMSTPSLFFSVICLAALRTPAAGSESPQSSFSCTLQHTHWSVSVYCVWVVVACVTRLPLIIGSLTPTSAVSVSYFYVSHLCVKLCVMSKIAISLFLFSQWSAVDFYGTGELLSSCSIYSCPCAQR